MMKRFTMTTAACLLMGVSAAFAQNTKVQVTLLMKMATP